MPQPAARKALVYEARNLVNGHRYIGFTVRTLDARAAQHRKDARSKHGGFRFHAAIRKYGEENFVFEVMADFDGDEELAKLYECEAVAKYKPEYNISRGGEGGSMPQETRDKISAGRRGKPGTLLGRPRTPEFKAHMSALMKGVPRPELRGKKMSPELAAKLRAISTGRVPSDETRQRQSESRKRYYQNLSPERRAELSAKASSSVAKLHEKRKIQVMCVNDGHVFESIRAAARYYEVAEESVRLVVKGKRKTAGGFVFVQTTTVNE